MKGRDVFVAVFTAGGHCGLPVVPVVGSWPGDPAAMRGREGPMEGLREGVVKAGGLPPGLALRSEAEATEAARRRLTFDLKTREGGRAAGQGRTSRGRW